ncbi:hypothetical protein PROFUN_07904 [Planoprotostelium fungivorum]|uniref:Phosphoglycerate mutase family protein n=1 Tax=Planoprotostelium fungivorum TaxID=1890364 RepID=A0A2P6NL14_9EUKA|nr:hypothetical protein PROFUN_07904 [Planoprotostelium fungivorum]
MSKKTASPPDRVVYFVRHGESFYNAAVSSGAPDPMIPDAGLTERGVQQATLLSSIVSHLPELDLIVTSPLSRALMTTCIGFAERLSTTATKILPDFRERLSGCDDIGSPPDVLSKRFKQFDFTELPTVWWYTGPGAPDRGEIFPPPSLMAPDPFESIKRYKKKPFLEPEDKFQARVEMFKDWLETRPEAKIAAVGHRAFIKQMIGFSLDNSQAYCTYFDQPTRTFYPCRYQEICGDGKHMAVLQLDKRKLKWNSPGTPPFLVTDLIVRDMISGQRQTTRVEDDATWAMRRVCGDIKWPRTKDILFDTSTGWFTITTSKM